MGADLRLHRGSEPALGTSSVVEAGRTVSEAGASCTPRLPAGCHQAGDVVPERHLCPEQLLGFRRGGKPDMLRAGIHAQRHRLCAMCPRLVEELDGEGRPLHDLRLLPPEHPLHLAVSLRGHQRPSFLVDDVDHHPSLTPFGVMPDSSGRRASLPAVPSRCCPMVFTCGAVPT